MLVLAGAAPAASAAPPANDNFADATAISTLPFADAFDTTSATSEPGEPSICSVTAPGVPPPHTVWYSYFAARPVTLSVDVSSPDGTAVMAIYQGTGAFSGLSLFACVTHSPTFQNGPFQVALEAGASISLQGLAFNTTGARMTVDAVPSTSTLVPTNTTLAVTPSPSLAGETVALTALVGFAPPSISRPAGTVQFEADGVPLGAPAPVDLSGQATLNTSALTSGSHKITAIFAPGAANVQASAGQFTQLVSKRQSATAMTVNPNPARAGQVATLTATVTGTGPGAPAPTGTVQFADVQGGPIGGPEPIDAAGQASIAAGAGAGAYTLQATYSGDVNFNTSTGTTPAQVNRADTRTTLATDPNPVLAGGTLSISVDVAVLPPGRVDPDGAVQLTVDGQPIGGPIDITGFSGFDLTIKAPTTPQTGTLGAEYLGGPDTNSSSASLQQTVAGPATSPPVALSAAPPPGSLSQAIGASQRLAAMTASLRSALAAGGLGALARITESFTAPAAGVLDQQIFTPTAPLRALAARASRVLVATAHRTLTGPGSARITLKLTSGGRRMVRRARALRLSVVTRFAPRSGGPASRRVDQLTVRSKRKRSKSTRTAARTSAWVLSQ